MEINVHLVGTLRVTVFLPGDLRNNQKNCKTHLKLKTNVKIS